MRFSIVLPDEVKSTIRDRAAAAGISQTEWARRLVLEGCDGRTPPGAPSDTSEVCRLEEDLAAAGARIDVLTAAIAAAEAEAERARTDATAARLELETATADRAALAVRVQVLEAVTVEKDERIKDLQTTIGSITSGARLTLPASTDADQAETTRPGILDGIRAWLRR